jgi:hypothetical protein
MNAKRESMKKQKESTKKHERAKREQAEAEKKQMYQTIASAEAKRRGISQHKITSCVKIENDIYTYMIRREKMNEMMKVQSHLKVQTPRPLVQLLAKSTIL